MCGVYIPANGGEIVGKKFNVKKFKYITNYNFIEQYVFFYLHVLIFNYLFI